MKELINFLLQFGDLNQQQIDLITSKTSELKLKKDDYFVEAGKIFNRIAFTLEGVLRICYYNNKGEEITKYFSDENRLLANPYNMNEPMAEYIQAVTDCRLLVFSRKDWEELSNAIVGWDSIVNKIFQKALMEKNRQAECIGFGRRHNTLCNIFGKIPDPCQPCSAFLHCLLSGHYTAIFEQDQEKYPLKPLFTKW